jgi:hypothetical protein
MVELGASADVGSIVALVIVSFLSYVAGTVFRKWPEKVMEYAEEIDGSSWFIAPETQRVIIGNCGRALIVMSFVALIAAGIAL